MCVFSMTTSVSDAMDALVSCAPGLFDSECQRRIVEELERYHEDLADVRSDGLWLQHVPRENQTHEMCEAALAQGTAALKYVLEPTESLLAFAIVMEAKRKEKFTVYKNHPVPCETEFLAGLALASEDDNEKDTILRRLKPRQQFKLEYEKHVCKWLKNGHARGTDECWSCVRMHPPLLEYVKAEWQTEEMCTHAVSADVSLLRFVAKQTPFIVGVALGSDPRLALKHVRVQTPALCRLAFSHNKSSLQSVWLGSLTKPFLQRVFSSFNVKPVFDAHGMATNWKEIPVKYVPHAVLDDSLALKLARTVTLNLIPGLFQTPLVCETAVRCYPTNLKHVPDVFLTRQMCEEAVAKNPYLETYLPRRFLRGKNKKRKRSV